MLRPLDTAMRSGFMLVPSRTVSSNIGSPTLRNDKPAPVAGLSGSSYWGRTNITSNGFDIFTRKPTVMTRISVSERGSQLPRTYGAAGLAAAALAVLTGCGGTSGPAELRAGGDIKHPTPRAVVVGRVDDLAGLGARIDDRARLVAPIRLLRGKTAFEPPPTTLVPSLTRDQAITAFRAEQLYERTLANSQPQVALGLLTSDGGGGDAVAGTGTPGYVKRPAWAVMFHDVVSEYGQSQPGAIASPMPQRDIHVNFVAFIDAATGKFLFADEIGLLRDVS